MWRGVRTDTVLSPLVNDDADKAAGSQAQAPSGDAKTPGSKNQEKKLKKMQLVAEKKLQKAREKEKGVIADAAGRDGPWANV